MCDCFSVQRTSERDGGEGAVIESRGEHSGAKEEVKEPKKGHTTELLGTELSAPHMAPMAGTKEPNKGHTTALVWNCSPLIWPLWRERKSQ